MEVAIKGLVIGGVKSGCGKTTIALGIMAAFRRRGFSVAPFKVGPDFIDPGHHRQVSGQVSRNLDGWMADRAYNEACFHESADACDIAVIEGVMGLFDGYGGKSDSGSTAQMAKWLGVPVVFVVDARSMARSVAALVHGFETFDPDLSFAGVIFNNVSSPRHLAYLTEALNGHVKTPCLGGVPAMERIAIPERHLGLVTQQEHAISPQQQEALADLIENHIDLDRLLDHLRPLDIPNRKPAIMPSGSAAVRIGLAFDEAFCFYYQDNIDHLARMGAEMIHFSPIREDCLPPGVDGLYFGGGYPELFARKLSEKRALRKEIREASRQGMPIYGECGGFMYLCDSLKDAAGQAHEMTGCFPFRPAMFSRLQSLGYREIRLLKNCLLGMCGQTLRGHEFHYSSMENPGKTDGAIDRIYAVADRSGNPREATDGYYIRQTLGSYIHVHFGSHPDAARAFTDACLRYRQQRTSTS